MRAIDEIVAAMPKFVSASGQEVRVGDQAAIASYAPEAGCMEGTGRVEEIHRLRGSDDMGEVSIMWSESGLEVHAAIPCEGKFIVDSVEHL